MSKDNPKLEQKVTTYILKDIVVLKLINHSPEREEHVNHHAIDKQFVLFFVLSFRLISSMTFRVLGFVFDFRQIDGQHWHYDYISYFWFFFRSVKIQIQILIFLGDFIQLFSFDFLLLLTENKIRCFKFHRYTT